MVVFKALCTKCPAVLIMMRTTDRVSLFASFQAQQHLQQLLSMEFTLQAALVALMVTVSPSSLESATVLVLQAQVLS